MFCLARSAAWMALASRAKDRIALTIVVADKQSSTASACARQNIVQADCSSECGPNDILPRTTRSRAAAAVRGKTSYLANDVSPRSNYTHPRYI